jgi:hypothetical protein
MRAESNRARTRFAKACDSGASRSFATSAPPGRRSWGTSASIVLEQRLLAGAIRRAHAGQLRRRIREDHVRGPTERIENPLCDVEIREIAWNATVFSKGSGSTAARSTPTTRTARPDDGAGDLHPAARPAAEVDDAVAAPQEAMLALQLVELVGRARSEPFALGPLVEGVFALVGHLGLASDAHYFLPPGPCFARAA